jgi:predicted phage-related endonuclease
MTERIVHDLIQGTPEWDQFRLEHFGASEAAAMLGLSKTAKRSELLHMKYTGNAKEFSDWVQEHILDRGHELEALARPLIEEDLGTDLYPVTCSLGKLSASSDGLTMDDETAWEHKQYNEALYQSILSGVLPDEHMPQAQQGLMVLGARRLKFTCSNGTRDRMASMWIYPDEQWFERICAGWAQFQRDLDEYVPVDIPSKPVATPQESLPVPFAQVTGSIAIKSNLDVFGAMLQEFIKRIPEKPETDQDFADIDSACRRLKEAEDCLASAEDTALASMTDVEQLRRTVATWRELARQTRLAKEKVVESRKKLIKENALAERRQKYADHVAGLNKELAEVSIVVAIPDFVGAIKGLKTIASLYDKLDTALANGKIAADAAAKDLRAKLDWHKPHAEFAFLFRDLQTLIQKPFDDFKLAVNARIADHKAAEEERQEKERARIRAEEQAKAEAAVREQPTKAAEAPPAEVERHIQQAAAAPTPAPTTVPRRVGYTHVATGAAKAKPTRPSDDEIIEVLSLHYRIHESKVVEYLLDMDLQAASKRLEAAF